MTTETSINFDPHSICQQEEAEIEREELECQRELQQLIVNQLDFDLDDDDDDVNNSYSDDEDHYAESVSPPSQSNPRNHSVGESLRSPDSRLQCHNERVDSRVKQEVLDEAVARLQPLPRTVFGSSNGQYRDETSINWDLSCPGDMLQPGISSGSPTSPSSPSHQVLPPVHNAYTSEWPSNTGPHFINNTAPPIFNHDLYPPGNQGCFSMPGLPYPGLPYPPGVYPVGEEVRSAASEWSSTGVPVSRCSGEDEEVPQHHVVMTTHRERPETRSIGIDATPLNQREYDQLEVLYGARGRRIEELTAEITKCRELFAKDLRITKHKLALVEGERNGMSTSLEQAQSQLIALKSQINELHGEIAARDKKIESLNKDYDSIVHKLSLTAKSAEALNEQLVAMTTNESLAKAKEQQKQMLGGLQERHEEELFRIKEELDSANAELRNKTSTIDDLRRRIEEMETGRQGGRWEQADLINKLTASLAESQRRCQEALNSTDSEVLSKLRSDVRDSTTAKEITDEVNHALQDELRELKEQLCMYEQAVHLGVTSATQDPLLGSAGGLPTKSHTLLENTFAQIGGAPGLHKSPNISSHSLPTPGHTTTSQEVAALRVELERCLSNYRNKRQQASQLREDLFTAQRDLQQARRRADQAERQAREHTERIVSLENKVKDLSSTGVSAKEIALSKQLEVAQMERKELDKEVKDLTSRLEEVSASERKLTLLNEDLSSRMSQMFEEMEGERQTSLSRLQTACSEHYETALQTATRELQKEAQEKEDQLKTQLDKCLGELDEVKRFYLQAVEERDEMEKGKQEEIEQAINKVKEDLKKTDTVERERFVKETRLALEREHAEALMDLRSQMEKDKETDFQRQLDVHVALAKSAWFSEHEASKQKEIDAVLKEKTSQFESEIETRVNDIVAQKMTSVSQEDVEARISAALSLQAKSHSVDLYKAEENARREAVQEMETRLAHLEEQLMVAQKKEKDVSNQLLKLQSSKESTDYWKQLYDETKCDMNQMDEERNALQTEIDDLRNSVDKLEREKKDLQKELAQCSTDMEASFKGKETQYQQVISDVKEHIASLEKKRDELENLLDLRTAENSKLVKEKSKMESDHTRRTADLRSSLDEEFRRRFQEYCTKKSNHWKQNAWRVLETECSEAVKQLNNIMRYRASGSQNEKCGSVTSDSCTISRASTPCEDVSDSDMIPGTDTEEVASTNQNSVRHVTSKGHQSGQRRERPRFCRWLLRTLEQAGDEIKMMVKKFDEFEDLLRTQEDSYLCELERMQKNQEETVEVSHRKMLELRTNYAETLSAMQKQLDEDKLTMEKIRKERGELITQVEELDHQLREMRCRSGRTSVQRSTSIQTAMSGDQEDLYTQELVHLRENYIEAVNKIKNEVLSHISSSQSRASVTLRKEVRKAQRHACHQFAQDIRQSLLNLTPSLVHPTSTPYTTLSSNQNTRTPASTNQDQYMNHSTNQIRGTFSFNSSNNKKCQESRNSSGNITIDRDHLLCLLETVSLSYTGEEDDNPPPPPTSAPAVQSLSDPLYRVAEWRLINGPQSSGCSLPPASSTDTSHAPVCTTIKNSSRDGGGDRGDCETEANSSRYTQHIAGPISKLSDSPSHRSSSQIVGCGGDAIIARDTSRGSLTKANSVTCRRNGGAPVKADHDVIGGRKSIIGTNDVNGLSQVSDGTSLEGSVEDPVTIINRIRKLYEVAFEPRSAATPPPTSHRYLPPPSICDQSTYLVETSSMSRLQSPCAPNEPVLGSYTFQRPSKSKPQ